MWKPVGTEYDSAGKRVCDNQSCNKLLSNDEYKKVSDKQKAYSTARPDGDKPPQSNDWAVWAVWTVYPLFAIQSFAFENLF